MILLPRDVKALREVFAGQRGSAFADKLPDAGSSQIRGLSTASVIYNFPDELLGGQGGDLLDRIFKVDLDDSRRARAFSRTLGRCIIEKVVYDAVKPGFRLDDTTTEENPEKGPTEAALKLFEDGVEMPFTTAAILARLFGYSLLFITFKEAESKTDVARAVSNGAKPVRLSAIPKTWVAEEIKTEDRPQKLTGYKLVSERFGDDYVVHPSRVIKIVNMEIDAATGERGASSMDGVYSGILAQEAILYGSSSAFWRMAAGLTKVKMPPDADEDDESAIINALSNLNVKTVLTEPEGYMIDVIKTAEAAINPEAYYRMTQEQLAGLSRYPKSILFGLSTGAVTGSELDRKNYIEFAQTVQRWLAPYLKQVLGLFGVFDSNRHVLKWNLPRMETQSEELERLKLRSEIDGLDVKAFKKTPDELRKRDGDKSLTTEQLTLLQFVAAAQRSGQSGQQAPSPVEKPSNLTA